MATLTRDSLIRKVFSDPKNYPYGFSRSGDFSINESKALSQYGHLIAALVDGKIAPETDEDEGYLAAAFAKKEPDTLAERAWVKYQTRINRPKLGSIYGKRKAQLSDDDDDGASDESVSEETDIEIGVDE